MIRIDETRGVIVVGGAGGEREISFSDPEAFELLSELWLRCGFDNKYAYGFSWLGRPVLQIPEDLIRIQEVIHSIQPDWIVESGIAHGGGLVFYASLCEAMGKGRVLGIDVEIREPNRLALERHPLKKRIELVQGDSTDPNTAAEVKSRVAGGSVLVVLDSKHSKDHVRREMEAYAPLVSEGSYLVVADGIMAKVAASPLAGPDWRWNHPLAAIEEFLAVHPEFRSEEPVFPFNEGMIRNRVTYWPRGFLRKKTPGKNP